jgi:hypothetical protein
MAIATSTLLIAGLAATAVGTGVAAYSARQAGKAQQSLNNYNAAVSDQAALDAARDGRIAANAQRAQNQRIKARQRALFAKAGVVSATGSPLLVQVEQAGELEMAALEQEQQANSQAARLRSQAVMDRMSGAAARKAGNLNSTATILQGVGSAVSTYGAYKGAK